MKWWTEELFIEKADLFLRPMEHRWKLALEEAKWIVKILEMNDIYEGRILDLMCGNGRIAVYLAKKGYEVIGLDFSPRYIEDAKRKAMIHNVDDQVKFIVGDIRDLKSAISSYAPFDAIINIWSSIGYYEEEVDRRMFRDSRTIIKPEGILLVADTISKEHFITNYSPIYSVEFEDTLILHHIDYDPLNSIIRDFWRFYGKEGKDWKFLGAVWVKVRLYSLSELAKVLYETGWEVIEAYDSLIGLTELKPDSPINFVAKPR
ncbi:MAG: class I SAM-dependent methyltransferase [Candidatus Njordarchaeales archaeon]